MIGTKENWTDKNSLRNYPLYVKSGYFPEGILVDASVVIRGDNISPCLSSLRVSKSLVSVVFSDAVSGHDLFAAVSSKEGGDTVEISSPVFFESTGTIKFGKINMLKETLKEGRFDYPLGSILLLEHCFCCVGQPVIKDQSINGSFKKNKGEVSLSFSGDFYAEIEHSMEPLEGEISIVKIALKNPSRFKELCSPTTTVCECPEPPIKQINSVMPSINTRNITIEDPDGILSILPINNGITIGAAATSSLMCPPNNLPKVGGKLKGEE